MNAEDCSQPTHKRLVAVDSHVLTGPVGHSFIRIHVATNAILHSTNVYVHRAARSRVDFRLHRIRRSGSRNYQQLLASA